MPRRLSLFHRNTPLTATGRLRLARCVVDDGWPLRRVAERFQVSQATAARWTGRYCKHGPAGMQDRFSRPHHQPRRTPAAIEERVVRPRREHRIGPVRLAAIATSQPQPPTASSSGHHLPALAACDRATGEPVRRYERCRPGELVHIRRQKTRPHPRRRRPRGIAPYGRKPEQVGPQRCRIRLPPPRPGRPLPPALHRGHARKRPSCDGQLPGSPHAA